MHSHNTCQRFDQSKAFAANLLYCSLLSAHNVIEVECIHVLPKPQETRCWRIPDDSRVTAEELKGVLAGIARMESYVTLIENVRDLPQDNSFNLMSLFSTIMQQVLSDTYLWVCYQNRQLHILGAALFKSVLLLGHQNSSCIIKPGSFCQSSVTHLLVCKLYGVVANSPKHFPHSFATGVRDRLPMI